MSTTAPDITSRSQLERRLLNEGYGPGAWHGPDLKAALADVERDVAFWRPAPGRHNIAEIALHHAYCVRSVRGQLSDQPPDPFIMAGEDWFELNGDGPLSWDAIQSALEHEQQQLVALVAANASRTVDSMLGDSERFDRVLGITCHAVYHAGQVQLIKRLAAE
jgi:hypothetical protein